MWAIVECQLRVEMCEKCGACAWTRQPEVVEVEVARVGWPGVREIEEAASSIVDMGGRCPPRSNRNSFMVLDLI